MRTSLLFITGREGRRGLDDIHERGSGDAASVELPESSSPKRSCDGFHSALVVELPLPAESQSSCLCLLTVTRWVQALWRGREVCVLGLYVRGNWQWQSRVLHTRTAYTNWEYAISKESDSCKVIDVLLQTEANRTMQLSTVGHLLLDFSWE